MTLDQIMEVNKGLEEIGIENIANVVLIKYGGTNGDVIKALFPSIEIEEENGIVEMSIGCFVNSFRLDWWNAPYKREDDNE